MPKTQSLTEQQALESLQDLSHFFQLRYKHDKKAQHDLYITFADLRKILVPFDD